MKVGEILRLSMNDSNTDTAVRNENIVALCYNLQRVLKFHQRLHKVFISLLLLIQNQFIQLIGSYMDCVVYLMLNLEKFDAS